LESTSHKKVQKQKKQKKARKQAIDRLITSKELAA
jgi:hypothetical protein